MHVYLIKSVKRLFIIFFIVLMEVKTVVIAEVYPVVFGWFLGATYKVCSV